MNKWFVMKSSLVKWRGWRYAGISTDPMAGDWFQTWREAMDYANTMARDAR